MECIVLEEKRLFAWTVTGSRIGHQWLEQRLDIHESSDWENAERRVVVTVEWFVYLM